MYKPIQKIKEELKEIREFFEQENNLKEDRMDGVVLDDYREEFEGYAADL
jgi:hypothetical protein